MSVLHLALDTCALIALDTTMENIEIAGDLHKKLGSDVRLLLDYQNIILGEYHRNITSPRSLGRLLIKSAIDKGAVDHYAHTPTGRCAGCLKKVNFDPSDVKFIGITQPIKGYFVTTEVKHLEQTRCRLVLEGCHVSIIGLAELRGIL